ncbi:TetR/AcrR family transcriptional regulator [Sediminibacterium ginsengisoli]|uniref:DNA-binding transcriptional regulator, AcrR family n=1 Tax=Sediminibacterium ginsengisoli TaxID=413434 RepID=A0A1T4L7G6_9BACT|nr:TetR/AcrR family transcriptional regulator [Sediminibacterium ginsengisoli]SJZ50451.1 DNA-binding transcriptional regulator, AcrR family [Sediminibacterium ginsengisoli]
MKFVPRSEQTRRFITEVTAGVFNRKGYAGTSMSDLTEATGLTKGSIYGNFLNKEEVAQEAFAFNVANRISVIQQQVKAETTAKGKLLANVRVFSSSSRHLFPDGGCPIMNTAIEADDTNEPLRKQAAAAFTSWKKSLVQIIRAGVENGEFRKTADPERTALSLIALIEGAILLSRTSKNKQDLDLVLATAEDLIRGLSK